MKWIVIGLLIFIVLCSASIANAQEFTTKFKCYFLKPDLDISIMDKTPFSNDMVICKIPQGKKVQMLDTDTTLFLFYKVKYKRNIGYIHKNALIGPPILENKKQIHDSIARVIDGIKRKKYTDSVMIAFRKENDIRLIQKRKHEQEKRYSDSLKIEQEKKWVEKQKKQESDMIRNGCPIIVTSMGIGSVDSACGVSLYLYFINIHPKTIKYIWLTGYIINAVGDRESCTVTGKSTITVRGVGPKKYGELCEFGWGEVWYNCSAEKFIPTQLRIQYMDSSIIHMSGNKLNDAKRDRTINE
jgi:hypothetical protein